MSKAEDDDMRDDYDFSKGVRGKYAQRTSDLTRAVVLDPDVAQAFPDAASVNTALRELMQRDSKK